jgi:glycosyltransferase involved in cell wall biosynthesis
MSSKKVALLTVAYYFDPAGAVGARRLWRFNKYLTETGNDCHVVAALAADCDLESGRVHLTPDWASTFWERRGAAIASGQPFTEPMPVACHVERILKKTVLAKTFALAWSREAAVTSISVLDRNPSISVVLSSFPPTGTHLVALDVIRRRKVKWIADFRDPFDFRVPAASRWGVGVLERTVFRRADAIIANTEAAAAEWRRKFPWAAEKIHVIWNGYDPEKQMSALPVLGGGTRRLVHAGSLYGGRNGNILVDGLARLRAKRDPNVNGVRIVLAGRSDSSSGIDEHAAAAAIRDGWLDFEREEIPQAEADHLTCNADGLLLLQPQSVIQVPAKLFDYLSIGRPILALIPRESSIEWILSRAGVPYVAVYCDDDAETVERKILSYLEIPNTVTEANDWFRQNFDARRQTSQLAGMLEHVTA